MEFDRDFTKHPEIDRAAIAGLDRQRWMAGAGRDDAACLQGHAELAIGGSIVMIADAFPEMGGTTPQALGGTPVTVMVYVDDVDDVFQRAVDAGATADRPVENQFYGDRAGQFTDPFGHKWFVATHIEDVPPDEMAKRAAAAMQG